MKTVHIIGSQGSGGAENFYLRLVAGLNQSGSEAVAIVPKGSFLVQQLRNQSLPFVEIKMRNNWDPIAKWQIRRAIKKIAPKVVQTYMSRATALTQDLDVPLVARLGGYYKLKYFQHCEHWVGNTHGIEKYLLDSGFAKDRVHYIGNFVDPIFHSDSQKKQMRTWLLSRLGWQKSDLVITGMGRFIHKKGFDTLIKAFEIVAKKVPNARLLLLGDGDLLSSYDELVTKLQLEDKVFFAGWITDASRYLNGSDILVCPSREEPLGNVILEGWASKLPVISTRTDGGVELITDGKNGKLVEIDNSQQMAEAIVAISRMDRMSREKIAQSGYQQILDRFSKEKIVEQYLKLYQQVIE